MPVPAYQHRTLKALKRAVKWGMVAVHMGHHTVHLSIEAGAPLRRLAETDIYHDAFHADIRVWPERCQLDGEDPLFAAFREVVHVLLKTPAEEEQTCNRITELLYRLWGHEHG